MTPSLEKASFDRILYLGAGGSRFQSFHSHVLIVGQATLISPELQSQVCPSTEVKALYRWEGCFEEWERQPEWKYLLNSKIYTVLHSGQA